MSTRFRSGEKGLYRMLNAFLWVSIGIFGAGKFWGIAACGCIHIVVAFLVVALLTVFTYLSVRGRLLGAVGLLGCLAATGAFFGLTDIGSFLASYVRWLFRMSLWQEEWLVGYEMLQVLLLSVICYLLQILLEKDFRIKQIGILLLFMWLVYCLVVKKDVSQPGVALILCYMAMVVAEGIRRRWRKHKRRDVQAYILWLTPFLGLYLVLLLCMPIPEKPYDWKMFKDIYDQVKDSFHVISQNIFHGLGEDYDLGLSGFSESGTLGGGIEENERELMAISGDKGVRSNLYLTGKIYDTFDGNGWERLSETLPQERYMDTLETLYAIRRYNDKYDQYYLRRTKIKVRYLDFKSRYLFASLKLWSIKGVEKPVWFEETEGSLLFEEKKGYGTEYEASYYQMNLKQKAFDTFLEADLEPDEKLLKEIMTELRAATGVEFSIEEFQNRPEAIDAVYGAAVQLSPEIEEFVAQITQDAESDVEVLQAIEKMLSDMTYNRTPGQLPEWVVDGSTFLDYFLLEGKQGYCSHFATAFVLLARAEGIPARYVQGYCVPMERNKETIVTADMAHAWPEVYLEDIGWIPYEPTPGYAQLRYTPWAIPQEEASLSGSTGTVQEMEVQVPQKPEEMTEEKVEEEAEDAEETLTSIDWRRVFGRVLLAFAAFAVIGCLFLFVERTMGRYRYKKMNVQQKYLTEIRRTLRILAWLKIEQEMGETLEELQKRLNAVWGQEAVFRFLEDYEEVLYGERMVEDGMLHGVKQEQERLLQILKQQRRWSYFYYCIKET